VRPPVAAWWSVSSLSRHVFDSLVSPRVDDAFESGLVPPDSVARLLDTEYLEYHPAPLEALDGALLAPTDDEPVSRAYFRLLLCAIRHFFTSRR
jgi:hypothetical protein